MAHAHILLFGRTGQVGAALVHALKGEHRITALDRASCDLGRPGDAARSIAGAAPDLVINAAAYTAVDQAESEPDMAHAVNGRAVAEMAQVCAARNVPFIHYSTDYVFDGTAATPYVEDDPPAPLGVYGASKRAGEEAVIGAGGPHLILRTAWVYDRTGRNFLSTIQRLARERAHLRIVSDQIGAPTWAAAIADATRSVMMTASDKEWHEVSGLYHMTAEGETSWFGFAQAIVEQMQAADPSFTPPEIEPITTRDYPTPARRPAYSVLSNEKLARVFGVRLPHWQDQLARAFTESAICSNSQ